MRGEGEEEQEETKEIKEESKQSTITNPPTSKNDRILNHYQIKIDIMKDLIQKY